MSYQSIMTDINSMQPVYQLLFTSGDSTIINIINTYSADKVRITGTAYFDSSVNYNNQGYNVAETNNVAFSNLLFSNGSVSNGITSGAGNYMSASIKFNGYKTITDYTGGTTKGIDTSETQGYDSQEVMGMSFEYLYAFSYMTVTKVEAYY